MNTALQFTINVKFLGGPESNLKKIVIQILLYSIHLV